MRSALCVSLDCAGYQAFVRASGLPVDHGDTRAAYADERAVLGFATTWPPGRNEACWCQSGITYKKCGQPRGR